VRRELSVVLALLLVLFACNGEDPSPDPDPEPDPPEEESAGPSGLRVGVVLPPGDTAAADEIDAAWLRLEELADDRSELAEVRVVVPDGAAFVADVASLLAEDDYGLVCVLGDDGAEVAADLASRWAGTEFCALPGDPEAEVAENAMLVELEVEQLGHVVGTALAALSGDEPAEALMGAQRTALDRFRLGMRAGFGNGELREATGDLEDLEQELDEALDGEVSALALDAGPEGAQLAELAAAELPTLAPATLLEEEDAALVWRVRWDRALEAVIEWQLDGELERPASLGLEQDVFELSAGGRSSSAMRAAVETVAGELARGDRDAVATDPEDEEEDTEP
jgi:hypothetical protein